ncbi:UNVERIFIED_ORG: phage FluMu gp28-like protein [Arthrobacter globiformis]|nr:phage FluMu gp28-like protein [Arthrobacter globiformis]
MAHSQFDQFLQEATYCDQESEMTLDGDCFYGLYTSWCCLSHQTPQPEHAFWAAMRQRPGSKQQLRMKGPAAADYLLTCYPAVV